LPLEPGGELVGKERRFFYAGGTELLGLMRSGWNSWLGLLQVIPLAGSGTPMPIEGDDLHVSPTKILEEALCFVACAHDGAAIQVACLTTPPEVVWDHLLKGVRSDACSVEGRHPSLSL
jgi:hypothetical protein